MQKTAQGGDKLHSKSLIKGLHLFVIISTKMWIKEEKRMLAAEGSVGGVSRGGLQLNDGAYFVGRVEQRTTSCPSILRIINNV